MPSHASNVDVLLLKSIANGDQMMNQSKYGLNSIRSTSEKPSKKMDSALNSV